MSGIGSTLQVVQTHYPHITRVVPYCGTGRLLGDFLIVRSWHIKTKQFLAELRLLHPGVRIYRTAGLFYDGHPRYF
jgi:hypothetical protein